MVDDQRHRGDECLSRLVPSAALGLFWPLCPHSAAWHCTEPGEAPEPTEKLKITEIPTLVLIKGRRPLARLEGRASEPQIQRMIAPYLSNPGHEPVAA